MSIDMSLVKFHCTVIPFLTSFFIALCNIVFFRDFAALMLPGTHNSGAYDVNFGVSKNANLVDIFTKALFNFYQTLISEI